MISIVTPSYNQARFIEKTIRSILLQNYPNLEFIVIDGGSKDGSVEQIERYQDWITHWVSEKDRGQSDAINKGFSLANGKILAWLNTDDFLLPEALFRVATTYATNRDPKIHAWVGAADKVDEHGRLIYQLNPADLTKESFYHWRNRQRPKGTGYFLQPACFFTKEAWEVAGPLDLSLHYCMDVDLWLKMTSCFRFSPISEKLAVAVGHSQAKTTTDKERTRAEIALVIAEHGGRQIAQLDLMQMIEDYIKLKKKRPLAMRLLHMVKKLLGS